MSIALISKVITGWNRIKDITLGDADEAAIAELSHMFGYKLSADHSAMIASLLANEDPMLTFGEFIDSGGLFRLVTGNKGAPQAATVRCPHCDELHVV